MNEEKITRAYLETLSFSDLSNLADEYGVEVPENLNRNFLIAELLELAEDASGTAENMIIASEEESGEIVDLPQNYNETQISCILRNPIWGFVFWNISDADSLQIKDEETSLLLRICSFNSKDELKPVEVLEVQASTTSQEQYILLPTEKKYIRVELLLARYATQSVLAFSPLIEIPQGPKYVDEWQPGKEFDFSQIMKLSNVEDILLNQYKKHRNSFLG
ncbi:MAG: DUF4912 domain-containing protein [Treponema sp.]|jgi:hypothetical protein|nr:DUF4912 domain-containing protein [Treponema sp.]